MNLYTRLNQLHEGALPRGFSPKLKQADLLLTAYSKLYRKAVCLEKHNLE